MMEEAALMAERSVVVRPRLDDKVERLPMAGRNWASLLNVLPGAISQTNSLEPDTGNANMPIYNGVSNAFTADVLQICNHKNGGRWPPELGSGESE